MNSIEKFWEERRKEEERKRFWSGVRYAGVAFVIATILCLLVMSVTVDAYVKLKNNGDRRIHAVEVVKP